MDKRLPINLEIINNKLKQDIINRDSLVLFFNIQDFEVEEEQRATILLSKNQKTKARILFYTTFYLNLKFFSLFF